MGARSLRNADFSIALREPNCRHGATRARQISLRKPLWRVWGVMGEWGDRERERERESARLYILHMGRTTFSRALSTRGTLAKVQNRVRSKGRNLSIRVSAHESHSYLYYAARTAHGISEVLK
jgi:hypothetical protein